MKVIRSTKQEGLKLTEKIINWIRKNRHNLEYSVDSELMDLIEKENLDSLKTNLKLRSHPILIDAFVKFPNDSAVIEEIPGEYYLILTDEQGYEKIITPDLTNFIKGYEYNGLLKKSTINFKNIKIEKIESGLSVKIEGKDEQFIKSKENTYIIGADMTKKELKLGQCFEIKAKSFKCINPNNYIFEDAHMSLKIGD